MTGVDSKTRGGGGSPYRRPPCRTRLCYSQPSTEDEVSGRIKGYPVSDGFRRFRATDIEVSEDRTMAIDRETEGLEGGPQASVHSLFYTLPCATRSVP